jgi:regulator of protease activity HflC (stomatin/prohibitin superfamily)
MQTQAPSQQLPMMAGGGPPSVPPASGDDADQEWSGVGCCCSCVNSGTVAAIQSFGNYVGYKNPGIFTYIPVMHSYTTVNLKVQQMVVNTDCKTKDNVTLRVSTAVQFQIDKHRLKQAVFETQDAQSQIVTAVNNTVRSYVPDLDLDATYLNKEDLKQNIVSSVTKQMGAIGYTIIGCLITDLRPDRNVLASMNQINASKRQREAAIEQGEAQKVLLVKAADAEAESKFLSGQGMARMRVEMAKGFKQSMDAMAAGGLAPQEAMNMMITTQYVDMLKDFATNPNKSAIMVPAGSGAKDVEAQVRDGFVSAAKLGQ